MIGTWPARRAMRRSAFASFAERRQLPGASRRGTQVDAAPVPDLDISAQRVQPLVDAPQLGLTQLHRRPRPSWTMWQRKYVGSWTNAGTLNF
jgi:hypothetical protein